MRSPRSLLLPGALLIVWAVACTVPKLPPAEPSGIMSEHALRRTQALYLYPDRLDRRMLTGALEALEARFDPIRFEPDGDRGVLHVGSARAEVPLAEDLDPELFREVLGAALAFVKQELGPELDLEEDETLELLAMRGALAALDRYTTIYSGRGTEDFRIRFSGKLHGIGSRIGLRDGKLVAVRVFPDSPAERGGLADGDAILEVDGEPTQPLTIGEAVQRIRGPEGSTVVLTVLREEELFPIEITRGEVVVPSVESEKLEDGFGYARIFQVSRSTPDEFRARVAELGELRGLVLDLRGNSGGSMLAAAALADMFIESGTIVRVVAREGTSPSGRSSAVANEDVSFRFPVAVLVDHATASAAEILSGAIAPLPHVTLIGQKTFGKGLIQRVVRIPDENLLKLTVAEYRLSEDRSIHKKGIEPDLTLYPVPDERLARLANVPLDAIPYLRKVGTDDRFPIEVASEVLRRGAPEATLVVRDRAAETIRAKLLEKEIVWSEPGDALPDLMPQALQVHGDALRMVLGELSELQIRITNPNPFEVPDAWLALQSTADVLPDQVLSLGRMPAGGSVLARFEVQSPEGVGAETAPVLAHVASGSRPLATQRLIVQLEDHTPEVEIEVQRLEGEQVSVTLRNRGTRATGAMRIDVPGAARTLESLAAGAEESFEVPIAGGARQVAVSLLGPRAQRRIEIPLPEDRIVIAPPGVRFERSSFVGRERLQVRASSAEGLREGWIFVDGEKRSYVAWNGDAAGVLELPLSSGDHAVRSKIETRSGVSVIDARLIIEN